MRTGLLLRVRRWGNIASLRGGNLELIFLGPENGERGWVWEPTDFPASAQTFPAHGASEQHWPRGPSHGSLSGSLGFGFFGPSRRGRLCGTDETYASLRVGYVALRFLIQWQTTYRSWNSCSWESFPIFTAVWKTGRIWKDLQCESVFLWMPLFCSSRCSQLTGVCWRGTSWRFRVSSFCLRVLVDVTSVSLDCRARHETSMNVFQFD